ncbi:MAG: hypothetical protein RIC80_21935 [Cyclobacteriaceae bacterium]
MSFICTNCGRINENDSFKCSNCGELINREHYHQLLDYSKRALRYGYVYRQTYEDQVNTHGEITIKYSLTDPSTYYEWLVVAALSGLVGTLAVEIVKFVGKQILNILRKKEQHQPLDKDEKQLINFVSDNAQLNQFTIYIQNYYQGLPKVDKRVLEAIIEEEIAHAATDGDMLEESKKAMESLDFSDPESTVKFYRELFKVAAQKRRERPNLEDSKKLFKELKKEIKQLKKSKKSKKKKKKKKKNR